MTTFEKVAGFLLGGIAGGAAVYGVCKTHYTDALAKKIDVDIPQDMLQKAINTATEREARRAAEDAYDRIATSVRSSVSGELDKAKRRIADDIAKEINEQRITISAKDVRNRVVDKAYQAVKDDLTDVVNDVKEKVQHNFEFYPFGSFGWKK